MLRRFFTVSFLVLSLPLSGVSLAENKVHEYKLDNGLKIVIKEDHRAPVVVSQVWYKVGSSYEYGGITGISHVLEHMMFKGTQAHGPNEFSRIIAENGGRENAFTSRDYTAYYQQLDKDRLPISFELEADRMRNLTLPDEEFKKEVQVVMEERRLRTEDNPQSITSEHFNATAFLNSPAGNPVIGWMDDLENLTIEDLRAWYKTWYSPNNATLVVVGDVKPDEVLELAKKYFGPLQPSTLPVLKPRKEVTQRGLRRLVVKAPAELPYVVMGYKVPVVKTAKEEWEPYALEVLAGILDGGDSARFSKRLVREMQLAAGAGVGYQPYARDETLFVVDGTPTQGHTIEEMEKALRTEIERLRNEPAAPEELERIKAQVVASNIYEQDSGFYQAMQIGSLETVGLSWQLMDQYVDKIRAVTAEQVQQVARKYLIDDQLTVATLDPLPLASGEKPPASPSAPQDMVR